KYEDKPLVIDSLPKDSPLASAEVARGDRIVALEGKSNPTWGTVETLLEQGAAGKTYHLVVDHQGTTRSVSVSTAGMPSPELVFGYPPEGPVVVNDVDPSLPAKAAGVKPGDLIDSVNGDHMDSWSAFVDAIQKAGGKPSPKQLQSVIGIAAMAGKAVEAGSYVVVRFMAGLSINLGILNLLPIPILDGGNILLLSLEGIRRRDFSLAFKERFIQVGLVFLLILFAYVMYNDVMRHLPFRS